MAKRFIAYIPDPLAGTKWAGSPTPVFIEKRGNKWRAYERRVRIEDLVIRARGKIISANTEEELIKRLKEEYPNWLWMEVKNG